MLKEIINSKKDNIGSLCLYLMKRPNLLNELDNYILINKKLTLSQKIYIYMNGVNIKCDCGKLKKWKSFKYGWYKTCGTKECIRKCTKLTNIENFGEDNPMKNEIIKNKSQKTTYDRYGFTSATKNYIIREKIKNKLNNRTKNE